MAEMARLLLGDEAVAQGALDAGIGGAFSYPGTPSTEIFEYILQGASTGGRVSARWSTNEKVAYEEALGMSYAGRRALVSMKHVGLNVAADPFVNSALTGVNAGIVLVVADDPGMHSSQNEQDSRYYGEFAQVPVFEPSNQQEAYDATRRAFEYSEAVGLPVMLRMVTRLCHSRANVVIRPPEENGADERPRPDPSQWTLVPSIARRRFRRLVDLQPTLQADAAESSLNRLELAGSQGVIAAGLTLNYVLEALGGSADMSLLKLGHYPIPVGLVRELINHCDDILVVEESYPFIETRLSGLLGVPGKLIRGRLSGDLPRTGELGPDAVASALGRGPHGGALPLAQLAARPPQLCRGCPHGDSFKALAEATSRYEAPLLFSDIGCYTLGVMPPYRAVHSCVDMGASISMAHGASQTGAHPVLATIGDSTFTHSGLSGLLGAVRSDANMTVLILDNGTVAMTGTQDSMANGDQIVALLTGAGVDPEHLHVLNPLPKHHSENVALIAQEIEHNGLSVLIPQRACVHVSRKARP